MRRKIGKPLRDKRGFTLIESVLGVLLFALVMTVVAALFVTASRITIRTQQSENAVNQVIALSEEAGADLSRALRDAGFLPRQRRNGERGAAACDLRGIKWRRGRFA